MALSGFRTKKLTKLFSLFDLSGDGSISMEDFGLFLNKSVAEGITSPGTPKYEKMRAQINAMWDTLRGQADSNRDNKVTREEWLAWNTKADEQAKANGGRYPLQDLMDAWLDILDGNGDGFITPDEYRIAVRTWSMKDVDVDRMFAEASNRGLIKQGEPGVRKEAVLEVMTENYFSEDPASPFTHIHGYVQ